MRIQVSVVEILSIINETEYALGFILVAWIDTATQCCVCWSSRSAWNDDEKLFEIGFKNSTIADADSIWKTTSEKNEDKKRIEQNFWIWR